MRSHVPPLVLALLAAAFAVAGPAAALPVGAVTLAADATNATAMPGESVGARLTLTNSLAFPQNVTLAVADGPAGWNATFEPLWVVVPAGGSATAHFSTRVPAGARASDTGAFTLEGRSGAIPVTNEVAFTARVPASRFALSPPPMAAAAAPGQSLSLAFHLENQGARATFTFTPGPLWNASVDLASGTFETGEARDVRVAVEVPAGATPGDYEIRLVARAHDGREQNATVALAVAAPPAAPEPEPAPAPRTDPEEGSAVAPVPDPATSDPPAGAPPEDASPQPADAPPARGEAPLPRAAESAPDAEAGTTAPGEVGTEAEAPPAAPADPTAPEAAVAAPSPDAPAKPNAVNGAIALALATGAAALAAPDLVQRFRRARPGALGGLLALFTRVAPPRALDHPARRALVERIAAAPGVRYRELARATGLAFGVLTYHLRVLERTRLVVARREAGIVRYYAPGAAPREARRLDPATEALLSLVRESGEVRLAEAARRLARDRRDVHRRAKTLVALGLAVTERRGDAVLLRPREV